MLNQSKYIKTIPFSGLFNWDAKCYLIDNSLNILDEALLRPFSYFTKAAKIEKVRIEDNEEYKILGVRSYGYGAYQNRISRGKDLKMKVYQQAKVNHLFWCKVDTKNGAFGIITEELADGLGSSNMTFAELDLSKISVDYLQLLFKSKILHSYMDNMVTGTTNRKYIKFSDLLSNVKIPLPSLEEQNALVADYSHRIETALAQDLQANILEQQIETYLLDRLGIKIKNVVSNNSILQLFQFSDMEDRWDLLATQNSVFDAIKRSNYPICEIGKAYDFISRGWKPNKGSDRAFKYVEIGAVDELNGITGASIVPEHQAPSRATQTIKTGDLIIGTTRPYLKKFAIVSNKYNDNVCSSGFQIINSDENNLYFLYEYLRSEAGILQFKFYMTGALYPAITNKDLKKIKIPLPPIEVQNEIVVHINGLKKQIKSLRLQATENRTTALTNFEQKIFG